MLIHVEVPDAVTPVARETLDGMQMILSSSSKGVGLQVPKDYS